MNSSEPAPTTARPEPPPGRRLHYRLYNWVVHWAYTPYAMPALILLALAESSFFPVPPDVLLLPLCLGEPRKAYRFAFWCSVASVVGGLIGYAIGYGLWNSGVDRLFFDYVPGFTAEVYGKVQELYREWDFWIVFAAGFSPIPYKVFTITAGVFEVNLVMFLLASLVSRSARFHLEAFLLARFGPPIRGFVEKRLGLMALLFTLLLIGGFVAVKYML